MAQNKAIEEAAKKVHVLILGTGDSGKTTLRKQIININTQQFEKPSYRQTFAISILSNVIDGALEVMTNMDENMDEKITYLRDQARECGKTMSPKLAETLIDIIWNTPSFQETLQKKKGHDVQVQDCFHVYAEELKSYPAWGGPDWVPSIDDCIRSRSRTTGVIKEEVIIDNLPMVIYDVGGQRSERRKWMHMFDNVTACIFVVAISEYDQTLFEERSKNRLEEAFDLFSECVNSAWLKDTTTLLFLNKKDLFLKKYEQDKIPLNASGLFPSAPSIEEADAETAIQWITDTFKAKKHEGKAKIHTHITTATDPQNVRKVFAVCKDVILQTSLAAAGFN